MRPGGSLSRSLVSWGQRLPTACGCGLSHKVTSDILKPWGQIPIQESALSGAVIKLYEIGL